MKVVACKITDMEWRDLEALLKEGDSVSALMKRWVKAYIERSKKDKDGLKVNR